MSGLHSMGAALISGRIHLFMPVSFLPGSKKDTSENVSFPAALFCFLFARIVEFKPIHLLHSEMASQVFLYIKGVPAVEIR